MRIYPLQSKKVNKNIFYILWEWSYNSRKTTPLICRSFEQGAQKKIKNKINKRHILPRPPRLANRQSYRLERGRIASYQFGLNRNCSRQWQSPLSRFCCHFHIYGVLVLVAGWCVCNRCLTFPSQCDSWMKLLFFHVFVYILNI